MLTSTGLQGTLTKGLQVKSDLLEVTYFVLLTELVYTEFCCGASFLEC